MRFKILHGKHAQKEAVKDEHGRPKTQKVTRDDKEVTEEVKEIRKYQKGDVVETDKDLAAIFNQGPMRKFEKLEDPKPQATSRGIPADVPPKREDAKKEESAAPAATTASSGKK